MSLFRTGIVVAVLAGLPRSMVWAQQYVAYDETRSFLVHEALSRPTTITGVLSFNPRERPHYYPDDDPRDALLAEVLFNPVLRIWSQLHHVDLKDGSAGWEWTVGLAPALLFRAYKQQSSPILSPSFLPTIFVELTKVGAGGTRQARTSTLKGVGLAYAHHSNGGEGCEFLDEERLGPDCVREGTGNRPPADQRGLRVRQGNFTTNFLEYSAHIGRYWLRGSAGGEGIKKSILARLVVEHHVGFAHVFGSPAPGDLLQLYGRFRPRVEAVGELVGGSPLGGLWQPKAYRVRGRISYEIGRPKVPSHDGFDRSQIRLSLQVQHRRIARDWSLGIDYFRGHDHYNVEFIRNITYWGIGLSWFPVSAGFL